MKNRLTRLFVTGAMAICFSGTGFGQIQAERQQQQVAARSLGEATKEIQKNTGCKVVSAKKAEEDGREVYKIKVVCPDGSVRVHTVSSENG